MFRITIVSRFGGIERKTGDIAPNANEVRRYLHGRVADVRVEPGTYETTIKPNRLSRPGDPTGPITVTVEELPRVG